MGVKEPFVIDLIRGKYFGAYSGEVPTMKGRKKLKHRPMGKTGFFNEKIVDYALKEKDIFKFTSPNYGEIWVLRNISGIPHVDRKATKMYQMHSDTEQKIKDLEKENSQLKNELAATQKELEYYKDEEAERNKRKDKSAPKIRCEGCNEVWADKTWRDNNGCPNCGSTTGVKER